MGLECTVPKTVRRGRPTTAMVQEREKLRKQHQQQDEAPSDQQQDEAPSDDEATSTHGSSPGSP